MQDNVILFVVGKRKWNEKCLNNFCKMTRAIRAR